MSARRFVSARKPNAAAAAMPTMRTALPVVSQSPEWSDPRIRAVTPAVAIAVEQYASASPKIAKPMNARAFGHVGFFMGCIQFGRHVSVNVAEVPESNRNGIDPPALCFTRPDPGGSRLLFSVKTQSSSATLGDRVTEDMPRIRAELETLVRIPSISHPG